MVNDKLMVLKKKPKATKHVRIQCLETINHSVIIC